MGIFGLDLVNTDPMQGFQTDLLTGRRPNQSDVVSGSGTYQPDAWDKFLGYKDAKGNSFNGWGGMALGTGQALLNGFMGMKQYGIMKDSLKENKRQFNTNFAAQKQMVNSQLEDRQRARVASNPGAYQSVGEYMPKYGIK